MLASDLLWPQAGAVVSGQDVKFRWQKIEQSLFYEIRVVTAAGDLVWEGRTEATEVRLPADVKLAAGEKYFIWVRAYLPEGKTLKSSTVGFTTSENN